MKLEIQSKLEIQGKQQMLQQLELLLNQNYNVAVKELKTEIQKFEGIENKDEDKLYLLVFEK